MSINLNTLSQARLGTSFSQIASAGNSNPAQALSQLSAVSDSVTRIGSATVAGVPATEYLAQVSLDKAAARAQAKGGAKAAQTVRLEIKALGTATLPVDVWVDAHHLVRQTRYHVPIPATGTSSGSGTATLTISFTSSARQSGSPPHPQVRPPTSRSRQSSGPRLAPADRAQRSTVTDPALCRSDTRLSG